MYEQESMQQEVIADQHLQHGGSNLPTNHFTITVCCECANEIKNAKGRRKYCDDCNKKRNKGRSLKNYYIKYHNNPEFRKKYLERSRLYKKNNREKVLRGKKRYYQKYKEEIKQKHRKWWRDNPEKVQKINKRKREAKWNRLESLGIPYEKRYYINNCVVCGRDISLLPPQSKLCWSCKENHIHELGTHDFSSHMRRKYDYNTHTVVPDFEAERKGIDIQLEVCGLK